MNGAFQHAFTNSQNTEEIARSSESYVNRSDCANSIALMQNSSGHNVYYTE